MAYQRLFCLTLLLLISIRTALAADPAYVKTVEDSSTVIVFVHGIFGNSRETWTGRDNSYFPSLVAADAQFKGASVYAYEYPTTFLNSPFSIDEIAENMRLFFDNDGVSTYQNIVFVVHSMGGLATRAYLLKNREVAAKTRLVYFFSTPTTGSEIAAIASLVSSNPQLAKMTPMKSTDYLADLQRQWLAAKFEIPSYCAYETRPTLGISVVTQASASNLCTRRLDPISADHISIVKPNSNRDTSYLAFAAAFREVMSSSVLSPLGNVIRKRSALPLSEEKLEKAQRSLSKDGAYTAFLTVRVVNTDLQYPRLDMMNTFKDVRGYQESGKKIIDIDLSGCNTPVVGELICLLLLKFDGKPTNGSIILHFGPLIERLVLNTESFEWTERVFRSGQTRKHWYVAGAQTSLEIKKIDWLILSDGELLSGPEGSSIFRFSLTNPSQQTRSIKYLSIDAFTYARGGCAFGLPHISVNLDWQLVVSNTPGGVVTELNGAKVYASSRLIHDPCSSSSALKAQIPVDEEIAANSTRQILVRITETNALPERKTLPIPDRLSDWPAVRIVPQSSGYVEIWPRSFEIPSNAHSSFTGFDSYFQNREFFKR